MRRGAVHLPGFQNALSVVYGYGRELVKSFRTSGGRSRHGRPAAQAEHLHHRRGFWLLVPSLVAAFVVLGALVAGGSVFAAPSTDASVNNYQQCANDKPGSVGDPTDCDPQGWINGILNANNSQYREDQVTPQRVGLDLPNNGPTTGRTITIKYLARKGQGGAGNHAYDSLATWNYTETNADRCQGLLAADCPGGSASTSQIP